MYFKELRLNNPLMADKIINQYKDDLINHIVAKISVMGSNTIESFVEDHNVLSYCHLFPDRKVSFYCDYFDVYTLHRFMTNPASFMDFGRLYLFNKVIFVPNKKIKMIPEYTHIYCENNVVYYRDLKEMTPQYQVFLNTANDIIQAFVEAAESYYDEMTSAKGLDEEMDAKEYTYDVNGVINTHSI